MIHELLNTNRGDIANVSRLELGAHTATHIDAPRHFVPGRKGVDQLDLEVLIGPAFVAEFSADRELTAGDLEAQNIPSGTRRLLCKTKNSQLWRSAEHKFDRDFIGLDASAASWLVERGFRLIGVDYLGVERYEMVNQGAPAHHILLSADMVILEGLDLSEVAPGMYQLICLPIKIKNGDGAPSRAILIKE
jgi:arylformamidase